MIVYLGQPKVDLKEVEVPQTIEEKILEVLPPEMLKVAKCESGLRQFNSDGSVLRGVVNSKDVGIFQINEFYHLDSSTKMGIDIYSIDGNIEYAKHLYETQGLKPWGWSRWCWNE